MDTVDVVDISMLRKSGAQAQLQTLARSSGIPILVKRLFGDSITVEKNESGTMRIIEYSRNCNVAVIRLPQDDARLPRHRTMADFYVSDGGFWGSNRVTNHNPSKFYEIETHHAKIARIEIRRGFCIRPAFSPADKSAWVLSYAAAVAASPEIPLILSLLASQARHESVSPRETCASRNVVPKGAKVKGTAREYSRPTRLVALCRLGLEEFV